MNVARNLARYLGQVRYSRGGATAVVSGNLASVACRATGILLEITGVVDLGRPAESKMWGEKWARSGEWEAGDPNPTPRNLWVCHSLLYYCC